MIRNFICRLMNRGINKYRLYKNKVVVGNQLLINGKLSIYNGGKIVIQDNVKIISAFEENVVGGYPKTKLYTCRGGEIIIGNNVGISNSVITAYDKIDIGDNVLIGAGCMITDSDHHALNYEERIKGIGGKSAPIVIKEGAFVGANSIILKGVTIGEKSIVGAGSVVTRSIPSGEIWCGNPATRVKRIGLE